MAKRWTREELIICFKLYFEIPFGKFDKQTKEIQELAEKLDRTPGSIAMKLCNFASFDPEHGKRGVSGLKNAAKADKEIFEEFYGKYDHLIETVDNIIADKEDFYDLDQEIEYTGKTGETVKRTVSTRLGQDFFRKAVLSVYENTCCITGISIPTLLIASHIVPWKDSKADRLNPQNGLCLNALHDKAFDKGLITIDKDYKVVVSQKVRGKDMDLLGKYHGKQMILPERLAPSQEYLEYHRGKIFIRN